MNGASVIAHNVAAQYTYDRIQSNKQKQNKTIQKLSSGYKINKAGDDAAGLAISESMRNKLNGLDQGENNIKDGIGIIQTAEGALTEVHSMLKRMTTLATESANGTFTDDVRKDIEAEVQQLKKEINRIAESTEYNGVYPLNNPLSNVSGVRKVSSAVETDSEKSYWYQMASKFVYVSKTEDAAKIFIVDTKYILHGVLPNQDGDISENGLYPGDIWIQQSANSAWDGLAISTVDATTGGIGIDGISVGTLKDANAAITTINDGVNKVSEYRAMFGATQNRLEHMLNSNRVTSENVTAAESRIRDTDMAKEVAEMTKENILQQAGQSILQQSINQPNQVLQMLQ